MTKMTKMTEKSNIMYIYGIFVYLYKKFYASCRVFKKSVIFVIFVIYCVFDTVKAVFSMTKVVTNYILLSL